MAESKEEEKVAKNREVEVAESKEEKWKDGEYGLCDRCGRSMPARDRVGKCSDCNRVICKGCLGGQCSVCDRILCKDHAKSCAECGKILCKEHSHYDEKEDKYYCEEHIPKGGCFIATAAYGTPFEPKIDVLRDFRDDVLNEHRSGRGFIKLYYTLSPPIADIISKHEWRQRVVRAMIIEPLVKTLSKR